MMHWIATHGATAGFLYTTLCAVAIVWQGLVWWRHRLAKTPPSVADHLYPWWQLVVVLVGQSVIGWIQHHKY